MMTETRNFGFDYKPTEAVDPNDEIPAGYWKLKLVDIGEPFMEANYENPLIKDRKARYKFEVVAGYNKQTGEEIQPLVPGSDGNPVDITGWNISAKIKVDVNGKKSTKYVMASALLGTDLLAYVNDPENPPLTPDQLIGLECWAKVKNTQSKKDSNRWFYDIEWDSYSATLPADALERAVRAPNRPGGAKKPMF